MAPSWREKTAAAVEQQGMCVQLREEGWAEGGGVTKATLAEEVLLQIAGN